MKAHGLQELSLIHIYRANRRNIMVALDTLSGLSVLVACIVMPFGHDILTVSYTHLRYEAKMEKREN